MLGSDRVWIGLNDIQNEGNFMWVNGDSFIADDIAWEKYQPDDQGNEDYVEINFMPTKSGNDDHCDFTKLGLCEKPLRYS